jgi:hypothetical protein
MRLGVLSQRLRGKPARPEQWDQRDLPATTARVAFAAIEKSDRFGTRWGRWVTRLGIRDTSQVSVLAHGARWRVQRGNRMATLCCLMYSTGMPTGKTTDRHNPLLRPGRPDAAGGRAGTV